MKIIYRIMVLITAAFLINCDSDSSTENDVFVINPAGAKLIDSGRKYFYFPFQYPDTITENLFAGLDEADSESSSHIIDPAPVFEVDQIAHCGGADFKKYRLKY